MKIALVVHDYNRSGGHSRYVAELAKRFAREHDVHVFANSVAEEGDTGVAFHHVPAWRLSALTCILTFPLSMRRLTLDEFDIVHTQGWCGGRHDVITAHICNDAWHAARKARSYHLSMKETIFAALVNPFERRLYRTSQSSWVIAISERVRNDLLRHYGRSERVAVIHHGVDVVRFNPRNRETARSSLRRNLGLDDEDLVALFVGDLRKGLLPAMAALARADGWRLLVVSGTPVTPYRRAALQSKVDDRVVFAPPTNQIESYYAAADAFVFPTPYDAFGMVAMEAMASGLPVVSSREAGAAELIAHECNGFLLDDPSDSAEIGRWLIRLRDAGLRDEVGRAARASVESLTWDAIAVETMGVYRQMLEERRT
jgi:UDP-glucose:(heptosyl)LPS alpha-1,3-glucosyltransferase